MILLKGKNLVVTVILGIGSLISVWVLLTPDITAKNTKTISGHLKQVEKGVYRNDISYNIYITEDGNKFQIPADWSGCFSDAAFKKDVKPGQVIQLGVKTGFALSGVRQVVSIDANGINYLSPDCINDKIETNKKEIPIGFAVFAMLILALLVLKNKKDATVEE
jgi:hypothetical protein